MYVIFLNKNFIEDDKVVYKKTCTFIWDRGKSTKNQIKNSAKQFLHIYTEAEFSQIIAEISNYPFILKNFYYY